jgi:ligand-binding sensor domain-containing protein
MKIKSVLTVSLLLTAISTTMAQQFYFTGYSIGDGLSQSVVNCIFQDSRGFLWIGTQNGLNRFNGYKFEVYTYNPDDSCSIPNNWIYAIAEDKDANLWIGTKGGLVRYNRKDNRFEAVRYEIPLIRLLRIMFTM